MAETAEQQTGRAGAESAETSGTTAVPLLEPRDGIPPVVQDEVALRQVVKAFGAGTGPVAVDAERASGYRYSQRAYLVQLRRDGAGTALIDPIACPDLSALDAALADTEHVLHAAGQDLACLRDVGFEPRSLFDTELAGRLLGFPRVGLGAMVENVLGLTLEKGHSAADWSHRPLPEDWLRYAALDVEVLVELRDRLEEALREAGKLAWAREEFEAVLAAPPKEPRSEPWRRTSGIHRVRNRRALAVVRALWAERDRLAQEKDLSPGRVIPDSAIVEAALANPRTPKDLSAMPAFTGRLARRYLNSWFKVIAKARGESDDALPQPSVPGEGPPPPNRWAERDPAAAKRLEGARAMVTALAESNTMPAENLIQPDAVRRLAWSPPDDLSAESVTEVLRGHGVREWQLGLVAVPISQALREAAED